MAIKLKKLGAGFYEFKLPDGRYFYVENGARAELPNKKEWLITFYKSNGLTDWNDVISSLNEARRIITGYKEQPLA